MNDILKQRDNSLLVKQKQQQQKKNCTSYFSFSNPALPS